MTTSSPGAERAVAGRLLRDFDEAEPGHRPPFRIDGNFGGTAGIAEMLLQSHTGELDLAWKRGALERAVVRSRLGQPGKVRYGGKVVPLEIRAGGAITLDGSLPALK